MIVRSNLRHAQHRKRVGEAKQGEIDAGLAPVDNPGVAPPASPSLRQIIGHNLRSLRRARKQTLEQLARAADTDVGNLSRIERGVQGITDDRLDRLTRALQVTPGALLTPPGSMDDETRWLVMYRTASPDNRRMLLRAVIELIGAASDMEDHGATPGMQSTTRIHNR